MAQIKKILNKQGDEVFIRTSTKAVVDENGYTAESRLQAMHDEINAAQLEIGAVESDLTPTENSVNYVTSGGLYNAITPIDTELYGEKIYSEYISGKRFDQDDGTVKNDTNWFITKDYIPVNNGDTVKVVFGGAGVFDYACVAQYDSNKGNLPCFTSNRYTDSRTVTIVNESTVYIRASMKLSYLETTAAVYINDEVVWNFYGRKDRESSLVGLSELLTNMDEEPVEESKKIVKSGGLYLTKFLATHTKETDIELSRYSAKGYYIEWATDLWKSSTTSKCKLIKIDNNSAYRLTANASQATRYAFLTTDTITANSVAPLATGQTSQQQLEANTTKVIYSPSDANYLYVTTLLSSNNTTPQNIVKLHSLADAFSMEEQIQAIDYSSILYDMRQSYIVDARTSSSTFGQEIAATNSDWGVSQYIDLLGAKYVKYYANAVSTSNNYAGVTGTVFYNESKEPLTDGVRLITYGSTYVAKWFTEEVPNGARYMKVGGGMSLNQNAAYKIIPIKLTTDNIYGAQEMLDEINNKANKEEIDILRNSRYSADSATSGTVAFLHFSDIHGDEGAAQAIKAYRDKYSSYINDMVSTGDVVYYYASDGIDFYTANGLTSALLALGNHDGAMQTGSNVQGSADWDAKGAQWDYEMYYAPYISGWGVTQPTDAATNYLMYYYKDYSTPKVRLIVLDVMHQDADQLQWFQNTLADANTNGYTVVVASHYVPNTYTSDYIVKRADGDKTTFHSYASNSLTSIDTRFKLNTVYADAVETFIGNDGKFAVWLCGHYHLDFLTYSNTHPNILFCAINQAGYRRGGGLGYRQVGDHCANMVTIHPASGLIKIHRIGLVSDRFLRPINVVVYDYINKKVISNY